MGSILVNFGDFGNEGETGEKLLLYFIWRVIKKIMSEKWRQNGRYIAQFWEFVAANENLIILIDFVNFEY